MKCIDVHIHLFPEDVVDDYMQNYYAHSRLPFSCRPTVQDLFKEYKGVDVARYVILPEWESTKPYESGNLTFAADSDRFYSKCYFYYYNKWLGKIQRENPKLVCFGGVHPDDPSCLDEFDRMTGDYGLKGMKLVPCMQHFRLNDRRLFPVYEEAEAEGMPILVHTGGDPVPGAEMFGHPRDIGEIAAAFPRLTIIMAHMGVPFFDETKEIMRKHQNVYADLSFAVVFEEVLAFSRLHRMDLPFLTREFWKETISTLIGEIGYERVLFGSDFPFIKPSAALDEFLKLPIPDGKKEMILWKNAEEILGL